MENASSKFIVPKSSLVAYLLTTFSLVFFMFYVDEGNYSVEWVMQPIAWIIFYIYFVLFLVILLLIDAFTFRTKKGFEKAALTIWFFLLTTAAIVLVLFVN